MADDQQANEAARRLLTRPIDRRAFLRLTGAVGAASFLAACSQAASTAKPATAAPATAAPATAAPATAAPATAAVTSAPSAAVGRTIKVGWVSPTTGPLAGFGEADDFVLTSAADKLAAGVTIGGTTYPIQIITKDSQSTPDRAASVAGDLITKDKVDVMLVESTPETTNPVADQCEAAGVPCISTVAPWQPYFLARQKDPANPKPFDWTYHFFWGLEDIIAVFLDMWSQVPTNKVIGALWPNDGDGNAWGDPTKGFPPAFSDAGYTLVDPGRYENLTQDFSSQISAFKKAGVEILTGVPIPPDFTTFWTQAVQQDFIPKIASVGKALLFPSSVEALGATGTGMSSEVWWSPSHPFTSSLTGQTAKALADAYTSKTTKQWTQPIGFAHALVEVVVDVLKRTTSVDDKSAIVKAIKATKLDTIVGPVDWTATTNPVPNVSKTPLVGGQWVKGASTFPYDLVIVSNKDHPNIPKAGTLQPIPNS